MAKDEMWHGIPRKDIPWFPNVDAAACIGCSLCYTTCGRGSPPDCPMIKWDKMNVRNDELFLF